MRWNPNTLDLEPGDSVIAVTDPPYLRRLLPDLDRCRCGRRLGNCCPLDRVHLPSLGSVRV